MSLPIQSQLEVIVGLRRSQFADVAATVILLYDQLLTFEADKRYYWGSKWTWTRVVYTGNRYLAPIFSIANLSGSMVVNINNPFCTFYTIYLATIAGPTEILFVELILTLRLYALYQKSKKVLFFLITALVLLTAASSTVVVLEFADSQLAVVSLSGVMTCVSQNRLGGKRDFLWAYWVPIAIFESIAFMLALYKTKQHIDETKTNGSHEWSSGGKSLGQRLVEALFRDSLIYFACMSIIVFIGAFLNRFGGQSLGVNNIVSGPIQSLLSIMGSRLLLSTHDTVLTASSHRSRASTQPITDIELVDLSTTSRRRRADTSHLQLDTLATALDDVETQAYTPPSLDVLDEESVADFETQSQAGPSSFH